MSIFTNMLSLAIETSCDETSAAVLKGEQVLSNIVSSQLFHKKYGGVVPELAARDHIKNIVPVTNLALSEANIKLKQIELISATNLPGLIGALLVGLSFGKALAAGLGVPFVPVNHIQAHLYSVFLSKDKPEFPFLSLIVSGGHTLLVLVEDKFKHKILGKTVDDAAGEAFDKAAKMLGLGYPGGPLIDKLAKDGDENFHKFPLAVVSGSRYDFSYSGIKTSLLYYLRSINFSELKDDAYKEQLVKDIAASFQKAAVESLLKRAVKASKEFSVDNIAIAGGVSANSYLKKRFNELQNDRKKIYIAEPQYSTDNAAMIGITGLYKYESSENKEYYSNDSFMENAKPRLDWEGF